MVPSIGRPRNTELDAALLDAAEALLLERGFSAITVEAVSTRAGTTRPAFYRRFDGIPQLVLSLLLHRFAIDLDRLIDHGNLPADLEAIQRDQVELFANPLVSRSLAGFLDAVQMDADLRAVFVQEFLAPRRYGAGVIIRRSVARGEIPENPDVEWACDLLTGPLLMRALLPGLSGLDDALISQTVSSTLHTLGYRST
ncbi:TetR/AcrR family transcriptional regulator [Arthrobacter sp. SDTb3-6]|uniref:TetR/AcrR family transcriptional regulator n=1 Tax=Arthrobacter sp. SDTb3-6 TaxID=2713571 RepID=UPI00159D8C36|nr:TetR/AcrR family transcriptional regulator [Arthrobacter sp. SDTb3-6]NVM97746.1 TetR/AcrR family transcriptional regulator [Arthrobacter sp. SDTb3-6]